jgi:hypothetical protein
VDPTQARTPASRSPPSPGVASPGAASSPSLGSFKDLRMKTSFASITQEGILKRPTYMTSLSNFNTAPKFSMAFRGRGGTSFIRSNSTPAPDTYTRSSEGSRHKEPPKYSFGGSSRFGLETSPAKKQPGPGVYNPRNPAEVTPKVGFGSDRRFKDNSTPQANPGPGAYETHKDGHVGPMFTAQGRHTAAFRARSLPGPGAYTPTVNSVYEQAPKCGFGTATRVSDGVSRNTYSNPGPGAYELQNFRATGSEAPKFSAVSRRHRHDLDSYITPGPGSYNSHVTSFGY